MPAATQQDAQTAAAVAVPQSRPGMRSTAEFYERLRLRPPIVSWTLLLLLTIAFGLEYLWGGPTHTATLVRMGAEVPPRILAGEWWRLLAPTFLHANIPHFAMNTVAMLSLAPFLERLVGSARFLSLYVVSGLLGSLFGTLFADVSGHTVSVGASGALFGLFGASAALGFRPRGQLPAGMVADLKRNAIVNFGLNVVISLRPNIDYLAHLGGAVAGVFIVGLGLVGPTIWARPDGRPRHDAIAAGAAVLAALALLGSFAAALLHGHPWDLRHPPKLATRQLADTRLAISLPAAFVAAPLPARSDGVKPLLFRDPFNPLLRIHVLVVPIEGSSDATSVRELFRDASADELSLLPPHASRSAPPSIVDIAGYQAIDSRFRYRGGAEQRRLFYIRPGYQIVMEVDIPAETPPPWQIDPVLLLGTLHDGSQAAPQPAPARKESPHG